MIAFLFCSKGYFPASGYRGVEQGFLLGWGDIGVAWSSSSFGISSLYASYLGFDNTVLRPWSSISGRTSAYSVRCVQAFIKVLLSLEYYKSVAYSSVTCKFRQSADIVQLSF